MPNCIWASGQCQSSSYTIVWKTEDHAVCPYEQHGTYNASVSQNHILIDTIQIAVTLTRKEELKRCNFGDDPRHMYPIHNTDRNMLVRVIAGKDIVNNEYVYYSYSRIEGPKIGQRKPGSSFFDHMGTQANELDPINPKLQFVFDKISQLEEQQFRQIYYELCRSAQRD